MEIIRTNDKICRIQKQASLFVCLPACLSVCLSVCVYIHLPACLPARLSVCLSVCLPACAYLFVNRPDCPSGCLLVCLPICLSIGLPSCLSVYVRLPACLLACLPACLSACLSACLLVRLPVWYVCLSCLSTSPTIFFLTRNTIFADVPSPWSRGMIRRVKTIYIYMYTVFANILIFQ